MAIYQESNGALHDDMDGTAQSLPAWPQGMTLLTDAEVATIVAAEGSAREAAAAALPNPPGFGLVVKDVLGGAVLAAIGPFPYAAFLFALQTSSWGDVGALLAYAQAHATLNITQYTAIKAAAVVNNIPIVL